MRCETTALHVMLENAKMAQKYQVSNAGLSTIQSYQIEHFHKKPWEYQGRVKERLGTQVLTTYTYYRM